MPETLCLTRSCSSARFASFQRSSEPVCGFSGIIPGERCPSCGRLEGEIPFERLRRITGYLVGSLDRWNDAKRAEEHDRVKHNVSGTYTKAEKAAREHAKHTAKSSLGKA